MESPRVFGIIAASAKPNEWFLYQLLAPIAAAIAWSMSLAGSFLTINPANVPAHRTQITFASQPSLLVRSGAAGLLGCGEYARVESGQLKP